MNAAMARPDCLGSLGTRTKYTAVAFLEVLDADSNELSWDFGT